MSISDGQPVNAAASNAAWMSRTQDTSTIGKVSLQESGSSSIADIQKLTNEIMSDIGRSSEVDAASKDYSSNNVIANGDNRKVAIGKIDGKFAASGGHAHTGVAGQGDKISANDLLNFNKYFALYQQISITGANGTSMDVSSLLTTKTPGGSASALGVVTSAPNNLVHIVDSSTQTFIEDAEGQRVYGRLTESSSVWTLSFYTNESGVETAHNLTSVDVNAIFLEVFDQSTRPTFQSNPFEFGTLDITSDVNDATDSIRGVLNPALSPQVLGGDKSWNGEHFFNLAAYLLSDVYLDLENDTTTTGSNQTIAQGTKIVKRLANVSLTSIKGHDIVGVESEVRILINKTGNQIDILHNSDTNLGFHLPNNATFRFKNNSAIFIHYNLIDERWHIIGGAGGSDFNLQAFGSVPNANGASYNTTNGNFNLEPADSTNPGGLAVGNQVFPSGDKSLVGNFGLSQILNSSLNGSNAQIAAFNQSHVILTNAALVSIDRIGQVGGGYSWFKVITNNTGNQITIINDVGTPATDRIITGTGGNIQLADKASLLLLWNNDQQRWNVIGGSGGSQGFSVGSVLNITNGGTVAISTTEKFQYLKVQGSVANVTSVVSTTPFGGTPPQGGTVLKVVGQSDSSKVQFNYSDIANGVIINGQAELGLYNMIEFIYDSVAQRYIECSRNF